MFLFNFAEEHSCSVDGDACLDKKNSQAEHGHYFCCCKGDLCNENFKAAPPKAEPIKPLKPVEPKKESDNMTAVVICIAVVLVFVIGAVSFFIVSMINETYWLNNAIIEPQNNIVEQPIMKNRFRFQNSN